MEFDLGLEGPFYFLKEILIQRCEGTGKLRELEGVTRSHSRELYFAPLMIIFKMRLSFKVTAPENNESFFESRELSLKCIPGSATPKQPGIIQKAGG